VQPPRILFGNTRHSHHTPHLRLTAQIRQQRAQQPFSVDPICLDSSRPPIHLQARWINDVIAYAVRRELPVQPKTIIACLVARDHFDRPTRLAADTRPHLFDQLE
jgi:hypothetical protein